MTRGSVYYGDADVTYSSEAIGVSSELQAELRNNLLAFSTAELVFNTLKTVVIGGVDTPASIPIPVEGIVVGDVLVSAVLFTVGVDATLIAEDVLYECSISDDGEVTLDSNEVGVDAFLLLTFLDISDEEPAAALDAENE